MKFMVGLQYSDKAFTDCIIENKDYVSEVYFSWGDFPNGRNNQINNDAYTAWELQKMQVEALEKLNTVSIPFNLLFNGNCYGKYSQSKAFFNKIGNTVDYICENYNLQSITTTSPLIAKFVKNNFRGIEVRSSVNMEIGTAQGMDYVAEYFDGYYLKRELNRDFASISKIKDWCDCNHKKLYILANSGCLNNCSAHTFHDNLVSHESEIASMDNAYEFQGICREYLKNTEHYKALIDDTNFIRPEDINKYEKYADGIKLATRTNKNPSNVLKSYIKGKFVGNILDILEPAHNIYPYHRNVQFTRSTRKTNVAPDLQFHFRLAAVACGLGEIGWSKMLLTPEFGPLQRVAFLFTDAELEYVEMYNGKPLCRKCGACVRECPGGCIPAIDSGKKITVNLDGKICEWADIDMCRCYAFYTHAGKHFNPFVPKEVWDKNENGDLDLMIGKSDVANEETITKIYGALAKYFPSWVGYNMAKCGGCIRGCVSMLEKKGGCLEEKFKEPLRTKKAWKLDR